MAAPKRSKFERERDLVNIEKSYLAGKTQADIADTIGLTQQQVSYDIRVIQTRWRLTTTIDLDAHKCKELARIDNLERVYWESWEASLAPRTVQQTASKGQGDAFGYLRTESTAGDPRFLDGVQWCIEMRCKILGLEAPRKTDVTSGGRTLQTIQTIEITKTIEPEQEPG